MSLFRASCIQFSGPFKYLFILYVRAHSAQSYINIIGVINSIIKALEK